jgi:hypothetical protein
MFLKRWIVLPLVMLMLTLNLMATPAALAEMGSAPTSADPALTNEISSEPEQLEEAHGVMATYHGELIDLSQGWQDAQICVEFAAEDVRCFADTAELAEAEPEVAQVGTRSAYACPLGWACLWEHANYRGRRLQWRNKGRKELSEWKFRDQASSAYNNRRLYGFVLEDSRRGLPNPKMYIGVNHPISDFTKQRYLYGGNWNDKVDAVTLG